MSIKSISVLNVMAFKRQWRKKNADCNLYDIENGDSFSEAFNLEFCDGINVLIGENGVGKTTVLKMIYAATQWSIPQTKQGMTRQFYDFFSNNLSDLGLLKSNGDDYSEFVVSDGEHKFRCSLSHEGFIGYEQWMNLNIESIYIPTTEMLSHAKGFLALNQKYKLPFDGTQVDIIVNASLPETRELPSYMDDILKKISGVIDGTVIIEDDTFYVLKSNGRKVDFSLEAEGLRKFGLLWKLVRNGLLEKGTILIWDEPESNLNPELFPLLVEILLSLEEAGVQIFIASHSYNLVKNFEMKRKNEEQVLFHSLYRASTEIASEYELSQKNDGDTAIYGQSEKYLSLLKENKIIEADEVLLSEAIEKGIL